MEKNWLNLKQSGKAHICDIQGLRVNREVKNPRAIWLYWFAAQQQTSTPKGQKIDFFDPKLNAQFNKLGPKF